MPEPDATQGQGGEAQQYGPTPVGPAPRALGPTPAGPTLERPKDGRLTRAHLEEAIRLGGSVSYNGEVITSVDALPDDADLAAGDADREAQVAQAIDAQIMTLMAQRNRLSGGTQLAPAASRSLGGEPRGSANPAPATAPAPAQAPREAEPRQGQAAPQRPGGQAGGK